LFTSARSPPEGFDERLSALEKGINGTPDVPGPAPVRDDTTV
jgi:hypothetical protein